MSETGLTTAESTDKAALMTRVRNGLDTWVEVGTALMELRDRKLWRDEAPDFTSFCQTHFGFTRRRADQLIAASAAVLEVEKSSSKNGPDTTEKAESPRGGSAFQAEELAKAPPDKQAEKWRKAVDTAPKDKAGKPKVTAAHVRRVVRDEPAPEPNGHPEPSAAPSPPDPEPWHEYNQRLQRVIALFNEAKIIIFTLADDRSPSAAFAGWLERKKYEKFFDEITKPLEGQLVTGWATTAQARKFSDGRNFLYSVETKAATKSRKAGAA